MKPTLFVVLLTLALSACSSSVPTQYYPLPDSAFLLPPPRAQETAVQIILVQPLKTQSLLYQTDANQLNFAQKHLWADNPENAIAASLSNKLNRLNPQVRYQPAARSNQPEKWMKVYIETFQGNYQGYTQITGYAQWANGRSQSFTIQTPQKGDGYAAMIQSLDSGLQSVATTILGQ